jgi:hypothetical protein
MAGSVVAIAKSGSSRIVKRRRREARSRAIDWRKFPRVAFLAGGTAAAGWLCVQVTAVDALVKANPLLAAAFSPDDPRIAPRLAMIEFRLKNGAVDPAVSQRAIESLERAPLIEEPFLLAALESLVKGNELKAEALLMEARRRAPRAEMPRILLLDRYLRTGRVREAAAEITVIGRLVPGTNQVLVPQLAKFAADPKTRGDLAQVLKSDPDTRAGLLDHLATAGADPAVILALAGPVVPTLVPAEPPRWQRLLLDSLVAKGDVSKARLLWARFAGIDPQQANATLYGGNFQRLPGPPPFNWQFSSSPAGVAEPTKSSALQVEYYGRADAELASQLLSLRPGRYRLAFRASGDTPDRGSSVSWRLACQPSKAELVAVAVSKLSYAAKQIGGDFIVPPANCSTQWLRLVGTPAEFPSTHSITISDLQIQRVEAP